MKPNKSLQLVNIYEEEEGYRIRLPILCHIKNGLIRNSRVETGRIEWGEDIRYQSSLGYLELYDRLMKNNTKRAVQEILQVKKIHYKRTSYTYNQVIWNTTVPPTAPNSQESYRGSYLVEVQRPQAYQLMFVEIVFNFHHNEGYEGIVFAPKLYTWLKGKLKDVTDTVNGKTILERFIGDYWKTTKEYLHALQEERERN